MSIHLRVDYKVKGATDKWGLQYILVHLLGRLAHRHGSNIMLGNTAGKQQAEI